MHSIFHVEGGVGKNIVASNIVRAIKIKYPDRNLVVVSPYPEVFLHNPNIYRNYKLGACPYFYEDYIKDKDVIIFKHEPYNHSDVILKQNDLASCWASSLNLPLDKIQPEIFFNQLERLAGTTLMQSIGNGKPIIAVQISGGIGRGNNFNWYRDLPPRYIQRIVNKFSDIFTFVQVKTQNQLELNNVRQVQMNLRELLSFLSNCAGALCIDSMVQHAMAAFKKPSIVCWIGNSPKVYGYDLHTNLTANVDYSGDNMESYFDRYPLNASGYQCPVGYNPATLFNMDEIESKFIDLYNLVKKEH